jgi:hypothetical protein
MKWLRKKWLGQKPEPTLENRSEGDPHALENHARIAARVRALERELASAFDRIQTLENELSDARIDIARHEVEAAAAANRFNAFSNLTEQRIDAIYRQIVFELKRAFNLGSATIETDSAIDARLAELLSAGLEAPVDPAKLLMKSILSGQLHPGTFSGGLTLYGFRLNRQRARERGDRIEIMPISAGGAGTAVYGPYKRLAPGAYVVTAHLAREKRPGQPHRLTDDVALDVYSPGVGAVLAAATAEGEDLADLSELSAHFIWSAESAADVIEIRLHQRSNASLALSGFTLAAAD